MNKLNIMKIMNTLLLLFISSSIFSQGIFDRFYEMDKVSTIVINQKMFRMLAEMNLQSNKSSENILLDHVKNLKTLKVYTTTDIKVSKLMLTDFHKHIKINNLEEIMQEQINSKIIKIFVDSLSDQQYVNELLMLVNDESSETVLLSLTGNINLVTASNIIKGLGIIAENQLQDAFGK